MIGVYSSTNYRSLPRGGSLEQLTYHDGICKSYGLLAAGLVGPVPSRSSEHETQQETRSRTILITRRLLVIKNATTIFFYRYKCEQTNKQQNSPAQHFQTKSNVINFFTTSWASPAPLRSHSPQKLFQSQSCLLRCLSRINTCSAFINPILCLILFRFQPVF